MLMKAPSRRSAPAGDETVNAPQDPEDDPSDWDPNKARKRRTSLRRANTFNVIGSVGFFFFMIENLHYEDNNTVIDGGIQIEPFNLSKEKEEGYFDEDGNYVECIDNCREIKGAWLDSIDHFDPKFEERRSPVVSNNLKLEIADHLSSTEIAAMKRLIADALEPGETVLRALRRLKGSRTNSSRKEKMSLKLNLYLIN